MMVLVVQMISILVPVTCTILYVCATIKYQINFHYQQIAWTVSIIHIHPVQQKGSAMMLLTMIEVLKQKLLHLLV